MQVASEPLLDLHRQRRHALAHVRLAVAIQTRAPLGIGIMR